MKPILPNYGKGFNNETGEISMEQLFGLNVRSMQKNFTYAQKSNYTKEELPLIFNSSLKQKSIFNNIQSSSSPSNKHLFPVLNHQQLKDNYSNESNSDGRVSPLVHIDKYMTPKFINNQAPTMMMKELQFDYQTPSLFVNSIKNNESLRFRNSRPVYLGAKNMEPNILTNYRNNIYESKHTQLREYDELTTSKINQEIKSRQRTLENLRLGTRKPTVIDVSKLKYSETKVYFLIHFVV
jgi:hypothetical protein